MNVILHPDDALLITDCDRGGKFFDPFVFVHAVTSNGINDAFSNLSGQPPPHSARTGQLSHLLGRFCRSRNCTDSLWFQIESHESVRKFPSE